MGNWELVMGNGEGWGNPTPTGGKIYSTPHSPLPTPHSPSPHLPLPPSSFPASS
ncbi:hypothetical protein [Tolypothrix sp. VBCCA 56010]|uniref:hypothetical protein n=1 Tax=Tolypothrix sp. VBCCA 56010 TaxID=3137731 RepID=UPI003D7D1EB8